MIRTYLTHLSFVTENRFIPTKYVTIYFVCFSSSSLAIIEIENLWQGNLPAVYGNWMMGGSQVLICGLPPSHSALPSSVILVGIGQCQYHRIFVRCLLGAVHKLGQPISGVFRPPSSAMVSICLTPLQRHKYPKLSRQQLFTRKRIPDEARKHTSCDI